ncbi:MAG: hypothetical protein U0802_05085 [Candidatus Binatia bacterium]
MRDLLRDDEVHALVQSPDFRFGVAQVTCSRTVRAAGDHQADGEQRQANVANRMRASMDDLDGHGGIKAQRKQGDRIAAAPQRGFTSRTRMPPLPLLLPVAAASRRTSETPLVSACPRAHARAGCRHDATPGS